MSGTKGDLAKMEWWTKWNREEERRREAALRQYNEEARARYRQAWIDFKQEFPNSGGLPAAGCGRE